MSDFFDPFQVFGIDYMVDIPDLDTRYYSLIQKGCLSLDALNLAYSQLKDPIRRLLFLCSKYVDFEDQHIFQQLFAKFLKLDSVLSVNDLLLLAKSGNWERCWIELRYFLKKNNNE